MSSYFFAVGTLYILVTIWVGVMMVSRKLRQNSELDWDNPQHHIGCQHCADKNRCEEAHLV